MTYYLAQSGVVFVSTIKVGPNWAPVLVIDPEDPEQVIRLVEAWELAQLSGPLPERPMTSAQLRMRTALRAVLADPPKVFAHYPKPNSSPPDAVVYAVCGKSWEPRLGDTKGIEHCPECTAIVEAGWVS